MTAVWATYRNTEGFLKTQEEIRNHQKAIDELLAKVKMECPPQEGWAYGINSVGNIIRVLLQGEEE